MLCCARLYEEYIIYYTIDHSILDYVMLYYVALTSVYCIMLCYIILFSLCYIITHATALC